MIGIGRNTCAVAVGLLFSASVYAGGMSNTEYKAGNERITGECKSAKAAFGKSQAGNW